MKVLRKIIKIDEELCNGCGQCVPSCAEGALEIVNGKARVIADRFCDGLGACLGECPTGALTIVEREADDFDEAAVEKLLKQKKQSPPVAAEPRTAAGCPSARLQTFMASSPCDCADRPASFADEGSSSALRHWPVQLRLVPSNAPFLKGTDLLLAADCVPVAYREFHRDLLAGKTVLLGCPKFDDADFYVSRLEAVFRDADLRSLTIAIMEVPCCGNLRAIVQEAQRRAGSSVPVKEVVVSARGDIQATADRRDAA